VALQSVTQTSYRAEFDLSVNRGFRRRVLNRTFTTPNPSVYKIEQSNTLVVAMIPS
jgi:hypothetical protein